MTDSSQGVGNASLLRRALVGLEQAEARAAELEQASRAPIAVIGMSCRVPGADDPAAFWQLLASGRDEVSPVPIERWDHSNFFSKDPEQPGRIAAERAGFLRGPIDRFDPAFFGIAPREAQSMDPQQRLVLEVSWEALEHAGQAPDRLERSATGVYLGACASDYANLELKTHDLGLLDAHFTSGIAHSIVSGRLSYLLGLQGPSITIDTACSSSLVAIHLACQALRAGDCRMALAGGVNLLLAPELYIALSRSRMLAPDGRCKTFDAAADGFGRGEGCGIVVLKRLAEAQADGDRILAVIRGSAVNQDGPSGSLTAPNGPAQESVIKQALARAGVAANLVGYIEAHGTGTELGDPLEVEALGNVFGTTNRALDRPLMLGSVKTNIGHLEGAAGVIGLIKLVLSLSHQQIPAHLHFRTPSPHIPWAELPFRVPTELTPWEAIDGRRLGGVSSFGFSGTNAHLVVEQAPERPVATAPGSAAPRLLALSARDPRALAALAARYATFLGERPELALDDVCFTANTGRAQFACRATVMARSLEELRVRLDALAAGQPCDGVAQVKAVPRDPPRIAFLFTGQGAQYAGMARALHEGTPVFRAAFDRVAELLAAELERPLLEVVFPSASASTPLDQTAYTQPALFALEFALCELLRSWGVVPDMVIGHSVGEYAAACVAGMLELASAARLVAERGRLMQALPEGGGMAAVFASEERVLAAISRHERRVAVAAVNGPEQTVISGGLAELESACAKLRDEGVRCQLLPVSHAFHSPLVDPMLAAFGRAAAGVHVSAPCLPFVSNVTGAVLSSAQATDPGYFRDHVRAAVRFSAGLKSLLALTPGVAIEIGPHPTLLSFAKATYGDAGPALLPTLHKQRPDEEQLLALASALYLAGVSLDFRRLTGNGRGQIVELPTYPFQRERFWFQATARAGLSAGTRSGEHPLLGHRLRTAGRETIFEAELSADAPAFVRQHQVQGHVVLPATAYLEALLTLARSELDPVLAAVTDVNLEDAMLFDADGAARTVQFVCEPLGDGKIAVVVKSLRADEPDAAKFQRHMVATLAPVSEAPDRSSLGDARARCTRVSSVADHYRGFAVRGLGFGEDFRAVRELWCGDQEALGLVELTPDCAREAARYALHPVLLDGCLQVLAAALSGEPEDVLFLPVGVGSYRLWGAPGTRCTSHVRVEPGSGELRRASLSVYDEAGALFAELRDVRLKRVARDALGKGDERWLDESLHETVWREATPAGAAPARSVPLAAAVGAAAQVGPKLRESAGISAYDAFLPRFEALCAAYVATAMQRLGWSPTPGETVDAGELATRLRVLPKHHQLFARLLAILAESRFLERGPGGFSVARPLLVDDPERELSALMREFPLGAIELDVTASVAREMAEALRGESDPMQLLFPGGSLERTERLYRDTPSAKFYNGLLAEVLAAFGTHGSESCPLRILELGGGTGGSTAHVLPRLPPVSVEYTFTDVGPLFVTRARERFGARPGMRFAVLDLERDPEAQGFALGTFDVVIASNVIHATSRLHTTLERVRRLLTPGGVLAMLEVTAPQRWFDLTVGFTEGWWAFADRDLRKDYATLPRERWFELLSECGFSDVHALPEGTAQSGVLGLQSLLLARSSAAQVTAREWLLFADGEGVAAALARRLSEQGDRTMLVERAAAFAFDGERAQLDPGSAADYRKLLAALRIAGRAPRGVVHAWALDASKAPAGRLADAPDTVSALLLAQALVAEAPAARLWLLTRGAQQISANETALDAYQAPIWGFARTARREHPELGCVCVDLSPNEAATEALAAELDEPGVEPEVALRGGTRYIRRLRRRPPAARRSLGSNVGARSEPYRLVTAEAGSLEKFSRAPLERRAPATGEVEILVEATGLNFKDVLNALGMYPGNPGPLGGECAGIVLAVGQGVHHVKPGDAVVAVASGCFSSHVLARAELVAPRPATTSAEEGAAFPIPFLTAAFCLEHLAQVRASDRVLIHAAAGGVGMAAVQLARRAGAVVFATAGSEWKRELVRALGAEHVFDSRSADFAEQIAAITEGHGVEVVLNSLAGPQLDASFRVLARGGRFVEIGKRGIKDAAWVAALERDIAYHVVDWGETAEREPALIGALLEGLVRDLADGTLSSLPRHVFALDDAARAFRLMAQAGHAGKIVVRHGPPAPRGVRADGTYFVTGGLSGLGLVLARWLAERGAGRIVLISRREVDEGVRAELASISRPGTTLVAESVDVTDEPAMRDLLERLRRDGPPLRGVLHGAGVLDDASLLQQNPARFARVFGPKIRGAELLATLTRAEPLDWFVLFSSAAGVLGSPGQANHSAANAFLDVFARERQGRGLHALSIDWGAWSEVGAAATGGVAERLAARGLSAVTPAQGLKFFERLLGEDAVDVAVLPANWRLYVDQLSGNATVPAFLSELVGEQAPAATSEATRKESAKPADVRAELTALPEGRRHPRVSALVRDRALRVLGLPASYELEPTTPLGDLGLDSLLSVELRNSLATLFAQPMPATLLFDYPTLEALTDYIMREALQLAPKSEPLIKTDQPTLVASIEELSDEEVERQLVALKVKK